ncbi:hypothetical protein A3781_15245 [Bacillus badius]|nr:hypothetical protein A3781_15245 [Bacillus badius]
MERKARQAITYKRDGQPNKHLYEQVLQTADKFNENGSLSTVFFIFLRRGPVAFHSKRFAFRGAGGEPPRRQSACGVSPVPLLPQESARLPFQSTEWTKLVYPYNNACLKINRSNAWGGKEAFETSSQPTG